MTDSEKLSILDGADSPARSLAPVAPTNRWVPVSDVKINHASAGADVNRVIWGDCLETMRAMSEASMDAIVTDPPYGLEFMGKEWDGSNGFRRSLNQNDAGRDNVFGRASRTSPEYRAGTLFQAWVTAWAAECLRILKPGGHLLAFGGTRTWHRLTVAIEDAGFEIRDSIAWLYGSGFPKSRDVSKAIDSQTRPLTSGVTITFDQRTSSERERRDIPHTPEAARWQGWGTALKPAFEPIVVARKPFPGTVAANVLGWGTGALNIDGCRIGDGAESQGPRATSEESAARRYTEVGAVNLAATPGPRGGSQSGRWPANVIMDEGTAAELDEQNGYQKTGAAGAGSGGFRTQYVSGERKADASFPQPPHGGGASRFFYCAKAGKRERPVIDGISHPTVKPLALTRWLVRLVTPPGGTVLDPFAGSGTTAEAAILEGLDYVVIEREADYLPHIWHRIERVELRGDER